MTTPAPKLRLLPGRRPEEGDGPAAAPRLDDTRLLAAIRAGDPQAATALYERSRPIVDRTVRRLLGRPDQDQQDISQQAMVEIVRSVDRYRGECPLDAWIATLAAHVVWKSLRRRKLERRLLVLDSAEEMEAPEQPARTALLRSIIRRVTGHLEKMDQTRAWAFLLHDVHGYDIREMARVMDISEAAAQSRLVRARKEIHERIAQDPELADAMTRREAEA
ncbi:MAG TPA: sigma-70 family RNA polymerase sigma factor [Polyangia bacterium]